VLVYQAIFRPPDHYQRHQVDPESIAALVAESFDLDALKAHLADRAICFWQNRFMLADTHWHMRTERELLGKLNQVRK